jgi:glycosyltransferase involved in cell wall biosynthesis
MKVVISIEQRFDRTPDGKVWTQTTCAYPFWTRYLEVFDQVSVFARIRDVPIVPADWKQADGERVSFAPVPYYLGPGQFFLKVSQIKQAAQHAIGKEDAVILRVGSPIAICIEPILQRTGHPYALEVVTDPFDVLAPGSVKTLLRPFLRNWAVWTLKRMSANAIAASYVTKKALQQRYPCPNLSVGISDVELPDEAIVTSARPQQDRLKTPTLLFVGTLEQLYKAPNILIDAVAACVSEGLDLKLIVVGSGKYRSQLEAQSARLNIASKVQFLGQLGSSEVREQIDQADLFVLPSLVEGLPRAMVEAMARGLPCIGSSVGGMPELIPPEDLVPRGDVAALALKIKEIVTDPERLARMSQQNLEKSKDYRDQSLHGQRIEFYRSVRNSTEAWLKQPNSGQNSTVPFATARKHG